MFNWISRVESLFSNSGPWWWRPIGAAISFAVLVALYFALS